MAWQDRGPIQIPEQPKSQPEPYNVGSFLLGMLPGGSLLDKALRKEQITGGDIATEAALSLVPFGLGKIAKGAKAVIGGAKATSRIGAGLEKAGGKLIGTQSLMTGAQARQMGVQPMRAFTNINKRTGLTNLDEMANVSRSLTGGKDSTLDMLTREAVGSTTGVKLQDLHQTTKDLIDNYGSLIPDNARKRLLQDSVRTSTTIFGGAKGQLGNLANPQAALDSANTFRATAKQINNSFNATPAQRQIATVYNKLADNIETSIYKSPGVRQSIPSLVKAGADDLLFKAQDLRNAGNVKEAVAYEKVAQELRNVKNVKELRSFKKDFVDIGKIDTATAQAEGARGLSTGALSGRLGLIQTAGSVLAPSVGGKAIQLGQKIGGLGTKETIQPSIGKQLASQAGVRLGADIFGLRGGQQPSLEESLMQQSQPQELFNQQISKQPQSLFQQQISGGQEQPQLTQPQTPYSQENLLYDMQRDPQNADKYLAYYQTIQKAFPVEQPVKLSATQAQRATSAQNALKDIPLVIEAIQSGKLGAAKAIPGASTAVGRRLLGTENLDAALFNIADNILRARSGAATPEAEVKRFAESFLPGPLDSEQAKIDKLNRAVQELQGYLNPVQTTSSPMEDYLLNQQQGGY